MTTRKRQRGNFMIIGAFSLILLGLILYFVQDSLRKSNLEQDLQKLADDTALYAAAQVPSFKAVSYLQAGEVRGWHSDQGYGEGSYVLSLQNAQHVDACAQQAVTEFVQRNAGNSAASGYFGGDLRILRASPKVVARREADGKEVIEYYVEVELATKWGSSLLAGSGDVTATAIAKAIVDYQSFYSISNPDYDNPTVIPVFANGVYAKTDVTFTACSKTLYIEGDVHANEQVVTFQNDNIVIVDGDVSGGTKVEIKNTDSMTVSGLVLTGDSSPKQEMPPMIFPTGVNDENFTQPIIIVDGDFSMNGVFPPNDPDDPYYDLFHTVSGETITGGTLYCRGGSLHLNGTGNAADDANIQGDWCFSVTEDVHFNNFGVNASSADTSAEIFFMVGGDIHLNNLKAAAPMTLNGSIYAANGIHINNDASPDAPLTILGGIYSGDDVYFNNMKQNLSIIHKPTPNVLPEPWVVYPVEFTCPPEYSSPRVMLVH